MPIIDIDEAQTRLPALIEAAARGEDIIISRDDKPLVRLEAIKPMSKLRGLGSMKGKIWIADDFDAPLPEDIQAAFEGK
jgi:antitoxin (DNA-binding transcriptional repressor) of toxin-antitoxin stability system